MHAYTPTAVTRFQYSAAKTMGNSAVKPVKHQMPRPNTLAVSISASEARYATATTPITNHRASFNLSASL